MSTLAPPMVPSSPLNSVLNFRDVGATINTLVPKSRPLLETALLYRSARPDEATPPDRRALTTVYGIKTIIDLRSRTEHVEQAKKRGANVRSAALVATNVDAAAEPVRMPGVRYLDISLNGNAFSRNLLWQLRWASLIRLMSLMAAGYRLEAISIAGKEVMAPRGLVGLAHDTLDFCRGEIRRIFLVLAEQTNYPILIHCTQGKDRTGLVVLLVLLLLELPIEAITADYVASQRELEPEKTERLKEISSIGLGEEFAGCPADFVEKVKEYIEEKHGGIKSYLDGCGVDHQMRERIRSKILTG
ncbi:MAG: hypothetical protein Q9163_004595 [Psora crenata]